MHSILTEKRLSIFTGNDEVRLEGENQIAEVFFNEQWVPICGHWFWDNDIGASLFCQKLGCDGGVIKRDSNNNLIKFDLQSDGLTVGKCDHGDQLMQCTDTYPDDCDALVVGGNCDMGGSCAATQNAAISIECYDSP